MAGHQVAAIDDRLRDSDIVWTMYAYPKDEALFLITTAGLEGVGPVPIEDVLAELP